MDFFSNVGKSNADPNHDSLDPFAQAIANRFGSGSLLTARLMPEKSPPKSPPRDPNSPPGPTHPSSSSSIPGLLPPPPATPMANLHIHPPTTNNFTIVSPLELPAILKDTVTSNILILDIRPHAAYTSARIPRALSLSVPSTLLKRPLFSLEKLSAMLPSTASRDRFSKWQSASRIIVYDADASAVPKGSNINGLLEKFKKEGFTGDLGWLQGGFQSVWRTQRDLVTSDPPSPSPEPEEGSSSAAPSPSSSVPLGVLRTRHLPMSAFSLSSTTGGNTNKMPSLGNAAPSGLSLPPAGPSSASNADAGRPAANPFFDAIRQNTELSQGITERIPLRLPRRVRRRIKDLPFQWLRDIARRSAPKLHNSTEIMDSDVSSEDEAEDGGADGISIADIEEGTEALAMQFYKIELAEQKRLMGVMEHHSKESNTDAVGGLGPPPVMVESMKRKGKGKKEKKRATTEPLEFPFSITAGVEKGAKNRYRHIWPFEHARVRLHQRRKSTGTGSPEDDYVNASYVQPLGTSRRYIATQGPLPATFTDFWTLCWEQNVHVIVMLTREVEGAMVKCGNYWSETDFGSLQLKLLSTSGASPSQSMEPETGMDFFASVREPKKSTLATIKRVFELRNTKFPESKPRIVTHLQYLEWPDMNVPDDPRGILGLIKEVDAAVTASAPSAAENDMDTTRSLVINDEVDNATGIATHAIGKKSPVLLHCSAGVGRTGGYIAVDALLDAIRKEMRKKLKVDAGMAKKADQVPPPAPTPTTNTSGGPGPMDVDPKDPPSTDISGTVPLHVKSAKGLQPGGNGETGHVVHVPLAGWEKVQTGSPADQKTPNAMDIDIDSGDEEETDDISPDDSDSPADGAGDTKDPWGLMTKAQKKQPSTMRWAEVVSDTTALAGGALQNPNTNSGSGTGSGSGSGSGSAEGSSSEHSDSAVNPLELVTPNPGNKDSKSNSDESLPRAPKSSNSDESLSRSNQSNSSNNADVSSGNGPRRRTTDSNSSQPSGGSHGSTPMFSQLGGSSSFATTVSEVSLRSPPSGSPRGKSHHHHHNKPRVPPVFGDVHDRTPRNIAAPKPVAVVGRSSRPDPTMEKLSLMAQSPAAAPAPFLAGVMAGGGDRYTASPLKFDSGFSSTRSSPPPSTSFSPSVGNFGSRSGSSGDQLGHQNQSSRSDSSSYPSRMAPSSSRSMSESPPDSGSNQNSGKPMTALQHLTETSSSEENTSSNDDQQAAIVDYKEPRPLHEDFSPPALSTYEEPIWQVVQDMREQRMSLCQSLRQYVFVHAALIEGVLMLVDEMREAQGKGSPTSSASSVRPKTHHNKVGFATQMSGSSQVSLSSGSGKGKRGASPTELPKEDKKGDVSLAKRPSMKRKPSSGDNNAQFADAIPRSAINLVGGKLPAAR